MSVPTVASLCAALGHHLSPLPGFTTPETEVTAIHISELDDPSAYLGGGELLLTTGLVLPANRLGCQRYVARLVETGVSALGFGIGPVAQEVPEHLVQACREAELPLLVVPGPTPFTMISRAYWGALSRATEQHLTDAVAAQRALVDAAASPDPAAAILRGLAGVLGGWAALLDAGGEVVDAYPLSLAEEIGSLSAEVARLEVAGAHSSASFTVADHVVVVFPLEVRDRVTGYLAAGSPRRLDQAQRRVVVTAAALLSLDTVRRRDAEPAAEVMRRCVALLLDEGDAEAARHLAARTGTPIPGRELCLLAVRGPDLGEMARAVARWCPDALAVREEGSAWFVVPADHGDPEALACALRTVDATVTAVLTEVVDADLLGAVRTRIHRTLVTLAPGHVVVPRQASHGEVAAALETFVSSAPAEVVEALVGYLGSRGQWEQAARRLGTHRNTVRYRVARARELLGLDLDHPDVAAEAWLALRSRGIA